MPTTRAPRTKTAAGGQTAEAVEAKPITKPTAEQEAIREEMAASRPVIVKLARIMGGLGVLQPEGENPHFRYRYIKDTQISGALRSRLAAERMMIIPEVLKEKMVEVPTRGGGHSYLTKMKIRFTVIDGDSGDSVSGTGYGYGDDSGDKGANKAFTSAFKYWLMKLFQIGGEDSEADSGADQRADERVAGGQTRPVDVQGANIEGVERGGRSTKITKAQGNQLSSLYIDLELTPSAFVAFIDKVLGDKLTIDASGDTNEQLRAYIQRLDADDAGKLISAMVEEKDVRAETARQLEGAAGGGYG